VGQNRTVQIAMLGPLEVRADKGAPVEVGGARLRTLLILLALDAGRVATTQRLIDGVWGDAPPVGAPNALQALVSRLRRAVPELPVESHPAGYRLALPARQVDVRRFEELVAAGRAALPTDPGRAAGVLREALDLWRGPVLADVADADFARAPAARLTELRLAATEDRIEAELRLKTLAVPDSDKLHRGGAGDLVAELEELVAENPLRERLVGQLMRALCAAGRPSDALAAYERTREQLADQLGTDPSPALAAVHLAVLRGDPDLAPAAPVVAEPPSEPKTNLRAGLTSFVGRDEDVFRVGKLVGESRLTTLTGPGGAGKTRLAVESARTLLDQMPDGVWLVELAPVTDPGELPQAMLSALGLREQALISKTRTRTLAVEPNDPLDRLLAALVDKRALLVLDNCEHLIDAAAALVDTLLGDCPRIRVLATSREPLGITGENLWPVGPLGLPPLEASPAEVAGYPSVRLFADRATAVRPSFVIDEHSVAPVVRTCRALDGMPLAIELAAARLRSMTPDQVANRLDDRFRLLTAGSRTALPRHQTLRAVVDWSWELLGDAERTVLRRLAVFAGGATVAAAEHVCAGGTVAPADVLDLLTALVDKSLVVAEGERYRLLETIRAYGLERLAEAGEERQVRQAHIGYFMAFAEHAEPQLRRADQMYWLGRFAEDHDNTHAALRWAINTGDTPTATRLVWSLGFYWWLSGRRAEGTELIAEVLAMPGEAPAVRRAGALLIGALNAIEAHRDFDTVRGWFDEAARLLAGMPAEELAAGSPLLRMCLPVKALFDANGDERALPLLEGMFDDPDPWARSVARMTRAHVLLNVGRRHDEAEQDFQVALDGFRAIGERWGAAVSVGSMAELSSWRGDHRKAADLLAEGMDLITELGTREDVPNLQLRYAAELWMLGEHDRARVQLAEAQRLADEIGHPESQAHAETTRAQLTRHEAEAAQRAGDPGRAEELVAEARQRLERAAGLISGASVAPQFESLIASGLGMLAALGGDLDAARTHHAEAMKKAAASWDAPVVGMTLIGVADLAVRTGDPALAAVLLGAATEIRGVPFLDYPDAVRVTADARAALGDPAFTEAYERGHQTTMDTVQELVAPLWAGPTPAA
jgi:predicted ATPase/DNA-binding SARP family transcriptional activator